MDLEETSNKLEPVSLVLKPSTHKPLDNLKKLVKKHTKSLQAIQSGLQEIDVTTPTGSTHLDKKLLSAIYGGKKHDLVQDNPSFTDAKVKMAANFEEGDDDEISPYAKIDNLRVKIFQNRASTGSTLTVSSGPGDVRSRTTSVSGQGFTLPGLKGASTTGEDVSGLYERVEEVIPSPFVEKDIVSEGEVEFRVCVSLHFCSAYIMYLGL